MRDESKERLELLSTIQDLGYESLRYSIFNDHRPREWETRIEYNPELEVYEVYSTMDRASTNGKDSYQNFQEARSRFIEILKNVVFINRYYVDEGIGTEYSSPLWDKSMIDIENMKYIVEQEIKKRHFESLHYVLFDEQSSQPWAFHLFYKDGKFMINGRDDRSYVMGNTIDFTRFEDAKIAFLERLEHFVKSNQFRVKIGKTPYYSSPLWDEKENHQKMRDESKERSELLLAIQDLGYSSLRYSIFSEEKPGEWEVVIEYNQVENLYFVYGTMDRGSFNGKHVYNTFQEAKAKFLDFLADIVIINRYYVKEGMPVNYLSPLWNDATE